MPGTILLEEKNGQIIEDVNHKPQHSFAHQQYNTITIITQPDATKPQVVVVTHRLYFLVIYD